MGFLGERDGPPLDLGEYEPLGWTMDRPEPLDLRYEG